MSLIQTVAPITEPVDLATAKLQARVEQTNEDDLITAYIKAARELCEQITGAALLTQTFELTLDSFPARIELLKPPLQSADSVKYVDVNGVMQTMSSADYSVKIERLRAYIYPAFGKCWPVTRYFHSAVKVTFTCGYADAAAVPQSVKNWILMHVAYWYENRAAADAGGLQPLPFLDSLLDYSRDSVL